MKVVKIDVTNCPLATFTEMVEYAREISQDNASYIWPSKYILFNNDEAAAMFILKYSDAVPVPIFKGAFNNG